MTAAIAPCPPGPGDECLLARYGSVDIALGDVIAYLKAEGAYGTPQSQNGAAAETTAEPQGVENT